VNVSELAQKMLAWEKVRHELDALTQEIEAAVLEIGKTQTVGNVRATYSGGRRTFDYRAAAENHPMVSQATIALHTTVIPQTERIDWRAVCGHVGIDDVPYSQSPPSVTVKLLN